MLHSKVSAILEELVNGNEELEKKSDHFHSVEREIDDMANKNDAELDMILRRTKILIERIFGGTFVGKNWLKIEDEIEKNLRDLKK